MFFLLIALSVVAAVLNKDTSLFIPAIVNAVGSLWSNGVLANFTDDPQGSPDWSAALSMATTLISLVFIGLSFVL